MIAIHIERDDQGRITSFRIAGHAEYDEPGKDIVCAAVSAISIGAINAVEKLLGVRMEAHDEPGLLTCRVPPTSEELQRDVQLLLEGMVSALEDVQSAYSRWVRFDSKSL